MSEDQKVHIIKTAGELFFRLGIRSVSIDDICHELGMSKKTFKKILGTLFREGKIDLGDDGFRAV